MSGSENPKNILRSTSQKRGLDNSLTESKSPTEEGNKQKAQKMHADKNDIEELKQLILANTQSLSSINASINTLNQNVLLLTQDMANVKSEMLQMEKKIKELEVAKSKDNGEIQNVVSELNAIRQLDLDSKLTILNIPTDIDSKQALNNLGNWAKIQLDDKNVRYAAVKKPIGKNSAILQLDFYELSTKHILMQKVRAKQKNNDKKYQPILTEMIFDVSPNNAARGLELHFRETFTETNRNIFNTARKHKDIFVNVWLSRGFIMVRKSKEGNPIKIKSIDHLYDLINSLKHPQSIQNEISND